MKVKFQIRKATTSLEFALVFPIFMLMVMGIFEFSRTVYYYHLNANAVREIARIASVNTGNPLYTNDQSNLGPLREKYSELTGVNDHYHPTKGHLLFNVSRGNIYGPGYQHKDFLWKDASSDQYICVYAEIPLTLNIIFLKYIIDIKCQCAIKSEAL